MSWNYCGEEGGLGKKIEQLLCGVHGEGCLLELQEVEWYREEGGLGKNG